MSSAELTGLSLRQKQSLFVVMVGKLIAFAGEKGYDLTFGEAYRTPEQAQRNADAGIGIKDSLHTKRLAVDFQLFKDGVYLTASDDYKPLGEFWESIGGSWGGRFSKPDGNHFSLAHEGKR